MDQAFRRHAEDVRVALSVLIACADRDAFAKLPNVTMEGERMAFRGDQVDVLVHIGEPAASGHVVVAGLTIRPHAAQS
jgi:hypothetical protein